MVGVADKMFCVEVKKKEGNVGDGKDIKAELDEGAVTFVVDPAQACRELGDVWTWTIHFVFPQVLRILRIFFEHKRRFQFEECVADPLQNDHSDFARVEMLSSVVEIVMRRRYE